jgi:hypothetical protein
MLIVCALRPRPHGSQKISARLNCLAPSSLACFQSKFYSNVIFAVAERRNITMRTEMHQIKPPEVN